MGYGCQSSNTMTSYQLHLPQLESLRADSRHQHETILRSHEHFKSKMTFNYKPPQDIPEGSGALLFIFHANFSGKEVIARLSGACSVQALALNDKFQLPAFLESHFVYSFNPVSGPCKLFIRLPESPLPRSSC